MDVGDGREWDDGTTRCILNLGLGIHVFFNPSGEYMQFPCELLIVDLTRNLWQEPLVGGLAAMWSTYLQVCSRDRVLGGRLY